MKLQLPSIGAAKRPRDADELEDLSDQFGADWRPGDRIMTWLNRHEGRTRALSRLVEDGWSWTDLGRAMHLAGIHYRNGQPIPGDVLRVKAYQARQRVKARSAQAGAASTHAPKSPPAPMQPGSGSAEVPRTASDEPVPDEQPAFQPARLAGWSGRSWRDQEAQRTRDDGPADPGPTDRADAVIARLMKNRSPT